MGPPETKPRTGPHGPGEWERSRRLPWSRAATRAGVDLQRSWRRDLGCVGPRTEDATNFLRAVKLIEYCNFFVNCEKKPRPHGLPINIKIKELGHYG